MLAVPEGSGEDTTRQEVVAKFFATFSLGSWRSRSYHPDGPPIPRGLFVIGMDCPFGTIAYHYAMTRWDSFRHVREIPHAPRWDGTPRLDTMPPEPVILWMTDTAVR